MALGTALPVTGFAIPIRVGANWIGTMFHRVSEFERWARRIAAGVFVIAGKYLVIRNWPLLLSLLEG